MGEINDASFDFVYELALRDATLRNAYNGDMDELRNNSTAKKEVKLYIEKLLGTEEPSDIFMETANSLGNAFRDSLTFGNIQKLINMTTKYFYISCYYDKTLRNKFIKCHCPMDSVMVDTVIHELEALKKESKDTFQQEKIKKFLKRGNKTLLRKPWSNMSFNDAEEDQQYWLFQQIVCFLAEQKNILPIEYDYLMWNQ